MQLSEIFTQNGYTVKAKLSLNDTDMKVLAIGTNDILWVGGIGISTSQVINAIRKLNEIISETLDDVHINITGFVIDEPYTKPADDFFSLSSIDFKTPGYIAISDNILLFNSIDDLDIYLKAHKNPVPTGQEKEAFDAYSDYIDTVLKYIETA